MRYKPLSKVPHMMHGGDYNPDQWMDINIWKEDMRLMKLAGCNTMSIGIFAWSALEPREGEFNFGWMDTIMDMLHQNGAYAVLATPSGARPPWMAKQYPEILRTNEQRQKMLFGERHNHCFTSPIYRQKVDIINTKLAQRYADHPALAVWHISNEYNGECHCELCQNAFREFLKQRYDNNLDKLNHEYWNGFWSNNLSDWEEIEAPSSIGRQDNALALRLDWKRFITHQTIDFMKSEMVPLRKFTPDIPVTTNFMGIFDGLDYFKMAEHVDVVSWDSYPCWQGIGEQDTHVGAYIGFLQDLNRSMKDGKPFMLMESVPSMVNWSFVNKPKRPGMHFTSSLQAVAHGSDTVQYFQWRKSRNGAEQYHGAVVDHCGHENTRVFADVAQVGDALSKLDEVVGTSVNPEVAVIFDWENKWAVNQTFALARESKDYENVVVSYYRPFWKMGIPVDVIDSDKDFSKYKLIVAPMLYMLKPGVAQRLREFVQNGGTLVGTYFSGLANENNLSLLGGVPGDGLREVFGVWAEEIDSLYPGQTNAIKTVADDMGLKDSYTAGVLCELIHAEGSQVIAQYASDFYAGRPAAVKNDFGKGRAYYVAFRDIFNFDQHYFGTYNDPFEGFSEDVLRFIAKDVGLKRNIECELPKGVTAQKRTDGETDYIFIQNYNDKKATISLDGDYQDMLCGNAVSGDIVVDGSATVILKRTAR